MCPIQWDEGQPSPRGPSARIFNTSRKGFVRLLGPPVGVFVHWAFGRTVPCLGGACLHCRNGLPSRWAGYAPVLLYHGRDAEQKPRWEAAVWYVPQSNATDLDGRVRGDVLEVNRNPKGAEKPLDIRFVEHPPQEPETPAFDVREVLAKLWRFAEITAPVAPPEAPPAATLPPDVLPFEPVAKEFLRQQRKEGRA